MNTDVDELMARTPGEVLAWVLAGGSGLGGGWDYVVEESRGRMRVEARDHDERLGWGKVLVETSERILALNPQLDETLRLRLLRDIAELDALASGAHPSPDPKVITPLLVRARFMATDT